MPRRKGTSLTERQPVGKLFDLIDECIDSTTDFLVDMMEMIKMLIAVIGSDTIAPIYGCEVIDALRSSETELEAAVIQGRSGRAAESLGFCNRLPVKLDWKVSRAA